MGAVAEATQFTYDALGRLTGSASSAGAVESSTWDRAGNRTGWATTDDPRTPVAGDPLTVVWSLDGAGLPATADVTTADGEASVAYGWDTAGSRTSVQVTGDSRLAGLWDQTTTWDEAGRLASVTTPDRSVEYGYDGLGRRVSTTTQNGLGEPVTSVATFDTITPLAATTVGDTHGQATGDDWDVWVRDVLGGELVQAATALAGTSDGADRWALLDNLGSLIAQGPATGDRAGAITQAVGWSDFGVAQPATAGWDEAGGFTGQGTDLALGQVDFSAHTLDPVTGGWTSRDSWAGLLGVPATLNGHAYVLGDPATLVDVDGHRASVSMMDGGGGLPVSGVNSRQAQLARQQAAQASRVVLPVTPYVSGTLTRPTFYQPSPYGGTVNVTPTQLGGPGSGRVATGAQVREGAQEVSRVRAQRAAEIREAEAQRAREAEAARHKQAADNGDWSGMALLVSEPTPTTAPQRWFADQLANDRGLLAGLGFDDPGPCSEDNPAGCERAILDAMLMALAPWGGGRATTGVRIDGVAANTAAKAADDVPIAWPPNNGFHGDLGPHANPGVTVLEPGTLVDRFGFDGGRYVAPNGTPIGQRALAPGTTDKPYSVFEVTNRLVVQHGPAEPWFGQPGMGTQYFLPSSVEDLLNAGYLRRVG